MLSFSRLLSIAVLALGLGAPALAAKPAFPQLNLADERSHGQRAVELLGTRLPEVAAHYGKSAEEFEALLLKDRMLRIDRRGRLFVEETQELPRRAPATAPVPSTANSALDGSLAPLNQTFYLHSRASAKRTIYLNFRGAVLTNTAWNVNGNTIIAAPFDTDGVPGVFSTNELQRIQYIWQRVAEDFAAFDVNVTTEPPAPDRLTRSSGTDDVYGTTVLITSRSGVYTCGCGGVAYIGVFDDTGDFYKPALVFYDALGAGNEKYVAEAVSHEVGHNLGLQHDGFSGGSYYGGHGSGVTSWAPIMGTGYSANLVQWSKGEYSGANNVEDDFLVAQANGAPLRADDHGNTAATATVMSGTSAAGVSSYRVEGVIERSSDVDVFSFVAAAGNASFSVVGAARSSNLDALLELRNSAGQLLASSNPVDALGAGMSVVLPAAGTYYLHLRGTGKGDVLVDGYSSFGSVGQYAISASAPTASNQPPTAVLSATPASGTVALNVSFSAAGSSDADGSIVAYDWTFGDGGSASGANVSRTYTVAGSYSAQLRVTDNSGLSSTRSVTITANPVVTLLGTSVGNINMGLKVQKNGMARASALVTVRGPNGVTLAGATVTGGWSGIVAGSASASSASNGVASFSSPTTRASGTMVFTVTGITLAGYQYQPTLNTETSDSITR